MGEESKRRQSIPLVRPLPGRYRLVSEFHSKRIDCLICVRFNAAFYAAARCSLSNWLAAPMKAFSDEAIMSLLMATPL